MQKMKKKRVSGVLLSLFMVLMSGIIMTVYADDIEAEKNGEVYVLFTSDIHCAVDKGFGIAGLAQIRESLEKKGYETILVDDGDAIQGEPLGTLSNGEAMLKLMNDAHYDVAIPGNHEFDYGMDNFLSLAEEAEFQYISCNFNKEGELVFDPYVIREAAGLKIGFVGVTTPLTLSTSIPTAFQDEKGEYIYGFLQDNDGSSVYNAVQEAVDNARADGADLVYVLGHLGNDMSYEPWSYADVISHTTGIDVLLDGHSHDTDQVVMKDKEGKKVVRSAVGTKLSFIGYSHISAEGKVLETGIWSWPNDYALQELIPIDNDVSKKVDEAIHELDEELETVIAHCDVELTINDPIEKDESGEPIRMIRRAETNLGDFVADAYRKQGNTDIGFINGGCIRASIEKGDITNKDLLEVHPYGNELCVAEVTGQQILDALEWGSRSVPDENGAFLNVSGLTYEIDTTIDSGCISDEKLMFAGVEGERRVKNVKVGDEPIDPEKTYTLTGHNYMLQQQGDGYTMFDGVKFTQDCFELDIQGLIDYIKGALGRTVGEEYADPYGQGRIVIK